MGPGLTPVPARHRPRAAAPIVAGSALEPDEGDAAKSSYCLGKLGPGGRSQGRIL